MGNAIYAFLLSFFSTDNVTMKEYQNQLSVSVGQSILEPRNFRDKQHGRKLENLFLCSVVYAQPTTFFRKPSRRILEFGFFIGKNGDANDQVGDRFYPRTTNLAQYSQSFLGLSQDVQFFNIGNLYLSGEVGIYLKRKKTDRIYSQFTFGEKATIGYNFDPISLELYMRHFSNGSVTEPNSPQNFYGLSSAYSF